LAALSGHAHLADWVPNERGVKFIAFRPDNGDDVCFPLLTRNGFLVTGHRKRFTCIVDGFYFNTNILAIVGSRVEIKAQVLLAHVSNDPPHGRKDRFDLLLGAAPSLERN
jgi:hypothetical protein